MSLDDTIELEHWKLNMNYSHFQVFENSMRVVFNILYHDDIDFEDEDSITEKEVWESLSDFSIKEFIFDHFSEDLPPEKELGSEDWNINWQYDEIEVRVRFV